MTKSVFGWWSIAIFISLLAILDLGRDVSKDLVSVLENVHNCGSKFQEFVSWDSQFFDVPVYCDNRVCDNLNCQDHRGNLHLRNHGSQIEYLRHYIRSPKSFVFTGWSVDLDAVEWRSKARKELIRLYELLCRFCKTAFVIYMEFKLKSDGRYYLHFHVVCGSVGDIRKMEGIWRRKVRYEYPVRNTESLYGYIRKYTAKTPEFQDEFAQLKYLSVVYKLQMCRYSESRKSCEAEFKIQYARFSFPVDLLVSESKYAYDGKYSPGELEQIIKFRKLWRENDNAFEERLRRAIRETNERYS